MVVVLRCTDQWNRSVELTESQWHGYILTNHPELQGRLSDVQQAIERPVVVTYDVNAAERENFYLPAIRGQFLLKVCVHYTGSSELEPARGLVVTAYFLGRVPPKERLKWSSIT